MCRCLHLHDSLVVEDGQANVVSLWLGPHEALWDNGRELYIELGPADGLPNQLRNLGRPPHVGIPPPGSPPRIRHSIHTLHIAPWCHEPGPKGPLGPGSRSVRRNCRRRTAHPVSTERLRTQDAGHRGISRHCGQERMDRGQPLPAKRVRRPRW